MYSPKSAPVISDLEELRQYVEDELRNIALEFAKTEVLWLITKHREPDKPREGMVAYADGTDWNPGQGEGVYEYDGAQWRRPGAAEDPDYIISGGGTGGDDLALLEAARDAAGTYRTIRGDSNKTYLISSRLTLSVEGQRWVNVKIKADASFSDTKVVLVTANYVRMRFCEIDGNAKGSGGGTMFDTGVGSDPFIGFEMDDCVVHNWAGDYALVLAQPRQCRIRNSQFYDVLRGVNAFNGPSAGTWGDLEISGNYIDCSDNDAGPCIGTAVSSGVRATDVRIINNICYGFPNPASTTTAGIYAQGVDGWQVIGNEVYHSGSGITGGPLANVVIQGNHVEQFNGYGIEIQPGSGYTGNYVISGNTVGNKFSGENGQAGILCSNSGAADIAFQVSITGNTISALENSATTIGIYMLSDFQVVSITGNTIEMDGSTQACMHVECDLVSITGNVMDGATSADGIVFSGNGANITGNILYRTPTDFSFGGSTNVLYQIGGVDRNLML